jgi:hypothetical protein
MREHIDTSEVYRLGESDLAFGELLPDEPRWLEQDEYEERTSVGFHLGRIARNIGGWRYEALSLPVDSPEPRE